MQRRYPDSPSGTAEKARRSSEQSIMPIIRRAEMEEGQGRKGYTEGEPIESRLRGRVIKRVRECNARHNAIAPIVIESH